MSDSEEEIGNTAAAPPTSGLFDDSDSDESDDDAFVKTESAPLESEAASSAEPKKKRLQKKSDANKKSRKKSSSGGESMSKKERMEALAKKRSTTDDEPKASSNEERKSKKENKKKKKKEGSDDKGYQSGDSYNSGQFVRTKADDDFIDDDDEDPDALRELYAEQHFEDERPSGSESEEEGKAKKKKVNNTYVRKRGPDALSDLDEEDASHPLMAAVKKMKRKKKEKLKLSEVEDDVKEFLGRMDAAADEDEKSYQERKPATKKLAMLPNVLVTLANREYTRPLLDYDLLSIIKRWIQPLPSGALGNVTVRQRLLEIIKDMTGEQGISPSDLKRSFLGKTVMALYTHRDETPNMKRQLKDIIEQWSRPIFQKSGNMKDLNRVLSERREAGIGGIARAQQASHTASSSSAKKKPRKEFANQLKRGHQASMQKSNRVSVPYSKGFQFTIRPADRISSADAKENNKKRNTGPDGVVGRDFIARRMLDKSRKYCKNQSSANMSLEGKACK